MVVNNYIKLEFPSRSVNESYARSAVAAFAAQLDPTLEEMLGENSNITAFQNCFTRYPTKDSGQAVFSFAFVRRCADLHDLPEDTSLRRKIKAHYLNGGHIYSYSGIYTG